MKSLCCELSLQVRAFLFFFPHTVTGCFNSSADESKSSALEEDSRSSSGREVSLHCGYNTQGGGGASMASPWQMAWFEKCVNGVAFPCVRSFDFPKDL